MSDEIRFSRRTGGFIVTYMRCLYGLILEPERTGRSWRFITQWGDLYELPTLHDAQVQATHTILLDARAA